MKPQKPASVHAELRRAAKLRQCMMFTNSTTGLKVNYPKRKKGSGVTTYA